MTPDEILTGLRDIHLPADLSGHASLGFALWPFLVLAMVLALLGLARLWVRTAWRRRARKALSETGKEADPNARWAALISLLRAYGPRLDAPPPPCVFHAPEKIGAPELRALESHLRERL